MSGHTIKLPLATLKLRIVELWRHKLIHGYTPDDYESRMTRYCQEYFSQTGERCDTVGILAPVEDWYDTLSVNAKDKIRKDIVFCPL